MTITLFRPKPLQVVTRIAPACPLLRYEGPEYDEEGRLYVFRYPPFVQQRYCIDRDRIFRYRRTHKLPGIDERRRIRDQHNAANFYEDIREIQTHADVIAAADVVPALMEA